MKTTRQTFKVTYTSAVNDERAIIVRARNEAEAIGNARHLCHTGSDFRNAVAVTSEYKAPRKQGFTGIN